MLNASTISHIAQNMSVTRSGTNLQFTFEHRTTNVPIETKYTLEEALNKAAITAAKQLFTQDCLGAILNLRMHGDDFNVRQHSGTKYPPKKRS